MSAQREMTLAEWCEQLHDGHRVNRELRELTARAEAAEQRVREVEGLRQKLIAEIAQYDETCDPSDPEDWVAPLRTVVNELEAALQGTASGSAGE